MGPHVLQAKPDACGIRSDAIFANVGSMGVAFGNAVVDEADQTVVPIKKSLAGKGAMLAGCRPAAG